MYRSMLLLALAAPCVASATMVWGNGEFSTHAGHGGHGDHGGPPRQSLMLNDGERAATLLWLPTLEQHTMPIEQGVAKIKPSGMDNYHLLYAVRESTQLHETALRYHYMRGKPSGRSPAELIYAQKTPLEIVPAPLTREHARYLSQTPATFIIRYQGELLAEHPIMLETSNGTRLQASSNTKGRVTFQLPDDFTNVAVGRDNNAPAEFFLYTHYNIANRDYVTTLSAPYHVNPLHWQSQSGALWSGLAGFACGLGLLGFAARRNTAKV